MLAADRASCASRVRFPGFGSGAGWPRSPEGVMLPLPAPPPSLQPVRPRDRVALLCQPLQTKPAPTSSTATSRWTAPRTSTSPAPWSSTGGPWTSTRPASSTSWPRGPPTRASTSWCVCLGLGLPRAGLIFQPLAPPLVPSLIHSFTQISCFCFVSQLLLPSFIHSLTHLLTHPRTLSLVPSFIHSFIHSCCEPPR